MILRRALILACILATGAGLRAEPLNRAYAASNLMPATATAVTSPRPRNVVGDWTSSEISLIQYRNSITGTDAPTNGTRVELILSPDGRYTYSGLLQVTSYTCTDSLFAQETGKAVVTSERLTLVPATSTLTSKDTCVSRFNYVKQLPVTKRTYQWKVDQIQRGTKLCLRNEDGHARPGCYWRSGGSDAVPTTSTGGAGWTHRVSGTTSWLRGVSCRNANVCLAVGDSGVILRSRDGGATWTNASLPGFEHNVKAVTCTGADTCIAVGTDTVLHGGNGRLVAQNSDAWLFGLDCPTASACVAVGNGSAIAITADGGATWKVRAPTMSPQLNGVDCISALQCVAVGGSWSEDGRILSSADGGRTWTRRLANNKYELDGVSCPTTQLCIAVGGDDADGVILTSTDGGATWKAHDPGIDNILQGNPLHGVACATVHACVAVGDSGTILTSADGGASWTGQVAAGGDPAAPLSAVGCAGANACVAVGDHGIILQLRP
jgi:photosystem II stability/assembly factor-like uncharacterized protein